MFHEKHERLIIPIFFVSWTSPRKSTVARSCHGFHQLNSAWSSGHTPIINTWTPLCHPFGRIHNSHLLMRHIYASRGQLHLLRWLSARWLLKNRSHTNNHPEPRDRHEYFNYSISETHSSHSNVRPRNGSSPKTVGRLSDYFGCRLPYRLSVRPNDRLAWCELMMVGTPSSFCVNLTVITGHYVTLSLQHALLRRILTGCGGGRKEVHRKDQQKVTEGVILFYIDDPGRLTE